MLFLLFIVSLLFKARQTFFLRCLYHCTVAAYELNAVCSFSFEMISLYVSCSDSCGTVCDSNFWLDLNYLEVAKAAQSCAAHFTALLYTEIYVDKVKANMEDSLR